MAGRDNRRVIGPEKCTPIHVLQPQHLSHFLTAEGKRRDARTPMEVRKMYFGLSNISQAKGSSYVEIGDTKVVCGVYGPREVAPSNTFKLTGQVVCEVKLAPFSCRVRRSPLPDRQTRELSTQVKEALEAAIVLEQYPKAQIDVCLTVLEEGGGLLAACVTAASLALSDAKIHMYDVVVAASLVWHEGDIYLDPSLEEEDSLARAGERLAAPVTQNNATDSSSSRQVHSSSASDGTKADHGTLSNGVAQPVSSTGSMTVGLMPLYANSQVALMVMSGSVSGDHLQEGLDAALDTCRKIHAVAKQVLLDHFKKEMAEAAALQHANGG